MLEKNNILCPICYHIIEDAPSNTTVLVQAILIEQGIQKLLLNGKCDNCKKNYNLIVNLELPSPKILMKLLGIGK